MLYGGRLGTALHELGFITEERLTDALARAHGVPAIDLRAIAPDAATLVSKKLAQRFKVFPCRVRGKTLFLGMVDPGDHAAVAHIGYSLGYIVRPLVVPEFRMVQLLHDHYDVDDRWRYTDTHADAPAVPETRDPAEAAARDRRGRDARRGGGGRARARPLLLPAGGVLHRARAVGASAGTAWARGWTGRAPPRCASRSTCPRSSRA